MWIRCRIFREWDSLDSRGNRSSLLSEISRMFGPSVQESLRSVRGRFLLQTVL